MTELINDARGPSQTPGDGAVEQQLLINAVDVARARVRREKASPPLDSMHAEIARGEMAIILGVWETKSKDKVGVPAEWMRRWIGYEELPEGWRPTHKQGLLDTIKRAKSIRKAMEEMRNAEANTSPSSASGKTSSTTSNETTNEKTRL